MTANNNNQNLIDGHNNAPIDDGIIGGDTHGKGLSESTPQIQFGSGLPHVNPSVSDAINVGLMPEKFGGNGFKEWQQKMCIFLTMLNLDKCLKDDAPVLPPRNTDPLVLASVNTWIHSDFLCKGWILSRLIDPLYVVYSKVETSKDLWGALEKKIQV